MKTPKINEKLNEACKEAFTVFQKIDKEKFNELSSKLEYVIGSYEFDKNPVGLHEYAKEALHTLEKYKKKHSKKVTKKSIEKISKAIKHYEKS